MREVPMARATISDEPVSGRNPALLVLSLTAATLTTTEILPGSMMPLMAEGLDTSEGMIGQAVTASAIVAIVTSLSIGKIVGNRDRRKVIIALISALVLSNVGMALAPNVWVMLASRLLLGAAVGIVWGLIPAIVLRLSPQGMFAKGFATVIVGGSIAGVIAAPLAAFAGDAIGWRWVFAGSAVLATCALAALISIFPSVPARPGALKRDLANTLRLPGLIAGMIGVMLLFGGAQVFFGYLVPFLERVTGLDAAEVSLVLLLFGLSGLAGTLAAPKIIGVGIRFALVLAPAMLATLVALLLVMGHLFLPAVLLLMMWAFGRPLIGVTSNAWVAHNFAENAESASGILVAVIQASMMLGAILGGVLIDNAGAKAPAVAATLILGFGAFYVYLAMKPRTTLDDPDNDDLPRDSQAAPVDGLATQVD